MDETAIRLALFQWLREQYQLNFGIFTRELLENGFVFQGEKFTIIGPKGIWKPRQFQSIPISITSTLDSPYDDNTTKDNLIEYQYRGNNPNHEDNIGLREAWKTRTPLVYFQSIKPGHYSAIWPVFIVQDNPDQLSCLVAINSSYLLVMNSQPTKDDEILVNTESEVALRHYVTTLAKQRLHQVAFRDFVLSAYEQRCALCNLRHPELLDAAHIIPDSEPKGEPIVQNGLALCKIHHAAYDQNILSVNPDYRVEVRSDILDERDGPMLKYGLQELDQKIIYLPKNKKDWADPERLEWRHERFKKAV